MSAIQATAVAVRLFSVWLSFYVIGVVSGILSLPTAESPRLLVLALFIAIAAVVILTLWKFPLSIARKLVPGSTPNSEQDPAPDTWLAVGCALLGLWVLSSALPKIAGDLLILRIYGSNSDPTLVGRGLIYPFLQIVLATWLILGAKGFRRLFWWARYTGYN